MFKDLMRALNLEKRESCLWHGDNVVLLHTLYRFRHLCHETLARYEIIFSGQFFDKV